MFKLRKRFEMSLIPVSCHHLEDRPTLCIDEIMFDGHDTGLVRLEIERAENAELGPFGVDQDIIDAAGYTPGVTFVKRARVELATLSDWLPDLVNVRLPRSNRDRTAARPSQAMIV